MVGELTYSRPINGEIFFWTDHDGMITFLFPPPLSLSLSFLFYIPLFCAVVNLTLIDLPGLTKVAVGILFQPCPSHYSISLLPMDVL